MPEAIITVGVSASGKTTWAEAQKGYVNINRDDIRSEIIGSRVQWKTYKFKREVEDKVTELQKSRALAAIKYGKGVIISDTNLGSKTRNNWIKFFEEFEYEVTLKDFPVTLEEAWKRDAHRENGVGHTVIYRQYQKWLEYSGRRTYVPQPHLPPAVIFDIDGTIADHQGIRSPFDWESVDQDRPRSMIIEMLLGYQRQEYKIILLSGRDSSCRELTEMWLADQGIEDYELYMRASGSYEKDTFVKEGLFYLYLNHRYNVKAVVDDRPSVLRLWHELGIPNVICVGNPWKEF